MIETEIQDVSGPTAAKSSANCDSGEIKVLSLITHFAHIPSWEKRVTRIDTLVPSWNKLSVRVQLLKLVPVSRGFDVVVFWYRTSFAFLFAVVTSFRRLPQSRQRLVFTTFLCDVSAFPPRLGLSRETLYQISRFTYYWLFSRFFDRLIVHTSTEERILADIFQTPPSRFQFIHYCVRSDAFLPMGNLTDKDAGSAEVVAAGRNRDWRTFLQSVSGLEKRVFIIAGEEDRHLLMTENPGRISFRTEVPFPEYREIIGNAKVLVLPLFAQRYVRSLGQITVFEAVAKRVPVLAAKSFQLWDYFQDGKEILFYEPGNVQDLRKRLLLLLSDSALRHRLAENAYNKMVNNYLQEHYTQRLVDVCLEVCR